MTMVRQRLEWIDFGTGPPYRPRSVVWPNEGQIQEEAASAALIAGGGYDEIERGLSRIVADARLKASVGVATKMAEGGGE